MIRTAFVRSGPLGKPAQSILRSNQHRWPTRSHNNPFTLTPRRHYAAPLLPPLFLLNTARIALTTVPILHRFKSIRSLTYGILAITAFTTAAVLVQTTEQHPFTQRTRLMLIDETAELAAAEDTERQLMVTHAHAILPDFHPWSRVVHRVVDRLIGVVGKELRAWKVVVIDQRDCVNAMVLANGTIFVFTGILHALWEMERDLDGGSVESRQQRATVDVEEAVARALAVALNGGKEKGSWWKSLLGMTFWSGRLSPPVSPDLEVGPMFTDTLAAVLAHEMAHVLSRHSAEDLGLTQFFQLFIDGLHGVLYALSVNLPGLTDLAGMGVDAVAPYLSTLPVSRLMEIEADVVGLFLMAVAGFNPSRASLFWKYLADRQGNPGDVDWNMFEEFLSTHPSHVRRSLELEKHETAAMEIYRAHKRIEDALRLHLKRGMADGTVSREREAAALDQLNHGMYTVLSEFVSSHDAFWYARKGFDQKLLEREQEVEITMNLAQQVLTANADTLLWSSTASSARQSASAKQTVLDAVKAAPEAELNALASDNHVMHILHHSHMHALVAMIVYVRLTSANKSPFSLAEAASRNAALAVTLPAVDKATFNAVSLSFARAVCSAADSNHSPISAVVPLRNLIANSAILDTTQHVHFLTRVHPLLLKYALLAKTPRAVVPVISHPITSVNKSLFTGLSSTDFLSYHYYSGLVWASLKRFDDAVDAFRICLAAPARNGGASLIQIEAWRSGLLCWLLEGGMSLSRETRLSSSSSASTIVRAFEREGLGSCISTSVSKAIEFSTGRKAYADFAFACESGNRASVEFELAKNHELFSSSNNLGLARQCLRNLGPRRIQKLTQTYITLSVSDIAKSVEDAIRMTAVTETTSSSSATVSTTADTTTIQQVKKQILTLIDRGIVHATLDESVSKEQGGMVSFHDSSEAYADVPTLQALDSALKHVMRLYDNVTDMDKSVGMSRDYLVRLSQMERGGPGVGSFDRLGSTGAPAGFHGQDGEAFDDDSLMLMGDEEMD
ncbi:COP9 signalosome complex subunit 3 [Chytriomyces hyalinus]|nr:COP9 signalosome complex subunit 3 [Chytriomyces hyalinus]